MKKYKIPFVILLTILLILGFVTLAKSHKKQNAVNIYSINYTASDISLNNFKLVSGDNYVYIPPTAFLKNNSSDDEYESVLINIRNDKKQLESIALGKFKFSHNVRQLDTNLVLQDIKLANDSTVDLSIIYKKNGKQKEEYTKIKLSDCIDQTVRR